MNFTDLFIRRPVVATVVSLVILLAGIQSYRTLNVRQYPRSDISVVVVTTVYVGANADLVRGFITTPLEKSIASADGIDYIESQSAQGLSTITVHLKLNYDVNAASTQIQAKVSQVRNNLPPEAQEPTITVQNVDDSRASMYLSFYSDQLDQNQITDYLLRVVQPKVTAISGVQRADILGARTFAMRIWLKSDRMAALGISPSQVSAALAANNYLAAVGNTNGSMISVNLVANTDLRTVEEFKNLVVKRSGNTIVRLSDISDVELGAEDYTQEVRFDGQKATFMGIWVLPTANSLDVIRAVRDLMPDIIKQLPAGMKADIPYDSTIYINDAIHEVIHTLTETLIIVMCVIFLFLGSWRSVLIPIVAIPVSLIGAVFLMLIFGFTVNLLTLLAIVLSVGLVVDDAIVVVENVERHLHEGKSPLQAALMTGRELTGPIIAMTITLAAVYAPIGIQGGLTGALFREFAFTLAGAVAVSGVVALTLSPMMCSKMLRAGESDKGFAGWVNRRFDGVRRRYVRLLTGILKYRPVTYTAAALVVGLFFLPFWMFSQKELAPKEDQGVVFAYVQAAPNATVDQTTRYTKLVNEVFSSFPEKARTFQLTSPTGGFSGMVLKPWAQRKLTAPELMFPAGAKLAKIPGVQMNAAIPRRFPAEASIPWSLKSIPHAEARNLVDFANDLVQTAMKSGEIVFADTDLKYDQPQTEIVFDREKVAALGLNLTQVGSDLSTLLGGNYVNYFNISGRSYKVIPEVKRTERLNTDQLKNYYVSGPAGQTVQLSTFASLKDTVEPRSLNRFQQLNSAKIYGVLRPDKSLDDGLKVLEDEAAKILPKDYNVDYGSEARQLRKEGNALVTTLILALILIYLVLAAQFESFRDPFVILAGSVPLALTGALMFSFFGFTSINIYSQIGLVTLVGLVAKNGILIVEFANKLQEHGHDKLSAIIEAAGTRLRPVLMTSVATVAGHTPLILANGPGAGARNSIGWVLVSGMIIGTSFTLFVVPAIYMLVARNHGADSPVDMDEPEPGKTAGIEAATASAV